MTELWSAIKSAINARPDGIIFADESGPRFGRQLLADVEVLGRRLDDRLHDGASVAVSARRGYGGLVALLACVATRHPYVPLDLDWPESRMSLVLQESGAAAVITVADREAIAVETRSGGDRLTDRVPDLAYVIFTSGSTGVPKGVMVESGALYRRLLALLPMITERGMPTMMLNTAIAFDISLVELLLPVLAGGCIVCPPPVTSGAEKFLAVLDRYPPTHIQGTPSFFKILSALDWPLPAGSGHPRAIEIWCGGEQLDSRLADSLLERFTRVFNFYGPTEATIWCTVHQVSPANLVAVGRPIGNTSVRVADGGDSEHPAELLLGGDGLAAGYVRTEHDRGRFVQVPGIGRSYRSGDLGYLDDDGLVYVAGRIDTQVKVDGHRLELAEIEAQLEAHPDVRHCAVVVQDADESRKLVAYVVAEGVGLRELRAHAATTLPGYAIPHRIVFTPVLPMTTSGKVDRNRLALGLD